MWLNGRAPRTIPVPDKKKSEVAMANALRSFCEQRFPVSWAVQSREVGTVEPASRVTLLFHTHLSRMGAPQVLLVPTPAVCRVSLHRVRGYVGWSLDMRD